MIKKKKWEVGDRDRRDGEIHTNQLFSRIGQLERDQSSIVTKVDGIASTVGSVLEKLDAITSSDKTNFNTLAAWAGVILVAVGMYSNLQMGPIKENIKLLHKSNEKLDESLQREMRDLIAGNRAERAEVEKSLTKDITKGWEEIRRIRTWKDQTEKDTARMDEALRWIEKTQDLLIAFGRVHTGDGHRDLRMVDGEVARIAAGTRDQVDIIRNVRREEPKTMTEIITLNPNADPRMNSKGGYKDSKLKQETADASNAKP